MMRLTVEAKCNQVKNNSGQLHSWRLFSAFLLLGANHLIGILPVAPIVGDGVAIANGATQASASREFGPKPIYTSTVVNYDFSLALNIDSHVAQARNRTLL